MPPALILLGDVRRQGVRVIGDRARTLLAALAMHGRTASVTGCWTPPPSLVEVTRTAVLITLMNVVIIADRRDDPLRDLLHTRSGPRPG